MTVDEHKLATIVDTAIKDLKKYLEDYIDRELQGRVNARVNEVLFDGASRQLRQVVRKAIDDSIHVEVTIKP